MIDAVTLCSATLSGGDDIEPPLGPLYIASALEELDVQVDWRDFQLDGAGHEFSGEPLARSLAGHSPVVAISCLADMLPAVIDATRRLHRQRPDTLFLLGGPGPSAVASRIMARYPWIAGVACGEGEATIQEWVRAMRTGCYVPIAGLTYRTEADVISGPPRPRNGNLTGLYPAYHLLDWPRYAHSHIVTSRGCSYRCSFCDVSALWNNRVVFRDLEATIAEMELLRDRFGQTRIGLVDDTFVLNQARVRQFCQALIERRANLEWGCFARINLMSRELIELMAQAGCRAVFYGIDSGSARVLARTDKRVRPEQIVPVLELSASYFEKIETSFIWGYPFETLADFRASVDLAARLSLLAPRVNVQFHMLCPLPLAPLTREFARSLREPEPEDHSWLLLPALFSDERALELRELIRADPEIYPGFYTFPTPAKASKRKLLDRSLRVLDQTVGRTFFEPDLASLLKQEAPAVEQALLTQAELPADRIGVGLALGFFRRIRSQAAGAHATPSPGT